MSNKHFVAGASTIVLSSCRGVVAAHPGLVLAEAEKVVYRPQSSPNRKVTILSGGGSGHEPAHAGYVGEGMLDAAVCGDIFASPTAKQITAGLAAIESEKGTLVIAKNYTGDRLNFALAVERARALGRKIETVVVGDDVAVGRKKGELVGRRGLAGTVLVHKIAGAAAENGLDLKSVTKIAQHVADNVATIGVNLGHCSVPGRPSNDEEAVRLDEIDIGMGIHNEPGYKRVSPIPTFPDLITELLSLILHTADKDRGFLVRMPSDKVVLLVNNLGGLSNLELNVLVGEIVQQLGDKYRIVPVRVLSGSFMTSLNAPGFSITLLSLPQSSATAPETVLDLLDSYTSAVGWPSSLKSSAWTAPPPKPTVTRPVAASAARKTTSKTNTNPKLINSILAGISKEVTAQEPAMTDYDTQVGDGDCGTTLVSGTDSLLIALKSGHIDTSNLLQATLDIVSTIETSMGGTSGALYGIFLSGFAAGLADSDSFVAVAEAASEALKTLGKYTPARAGDRTLMDALIPFVETIYESREAGAVEALEKGVEAAEKGYEATRKMEARLGRASYVAASAFEGEGVPDPGALGVVAVVRGILEAVREEV